jgi:hypothetical protein
MKRRFNGDYDTSFEVLTALLWGLFATGVLLFIIAMGG